MKHGDYVRLGKGKKVYQICAAEIDPTDNVEKFKLAATADHPDAAVREQDAFAWYPAERLTVVRRRS